MIRDYQAIAKTWFLKGKQRSIPTTGKHRGVKLLGILNYETGQVYCREDEKYDAEVFLEFLKEIEQKYPVGKIVIILDNSHIHHAKLIQPFLEATPRMKLVLLPLYSPELNLIKGLWKWLKADIINNAFYPTVKEIQSAVQEFIKGINSSKQKVIDRLCIRLYTTISIGDSAISIISINIRESNCIGIF